MLGGEPLPVGSRQPVLFGPNPMPLLPTPSPQAIRQKRFPVCCRHASPVLSPHHFIDVAKKARTKRLLALSNIMPVNQPPRCPLHAGGSPLCGPLPSCRSSSSPLPLLLLTALEPPMPFHLLSDGFPWAPRGTLSIISHPSAASRTCFLSPPPGGSHRTLGSRPHCFPARVPQSPASQQASCPGPGPGGAPPRLILPAARAPVHLIFTTDRTFHGELDAHSTGNENFMTVLTRSCRLHQLRKHGADVQPVNCKVY